MEMHSAPNTSELVAAMMQPGFYPKPPDKVTHTETHISHIFFAGDLVFKVKKPVRFSFLDYSTLSKRRFFLNEELRLNRRLAPSVYIGVVPITCDQSGWRLGGWGEPAEYGLVMRRLPERRMLPFLLETNQTTTEMMRELAVVLARFHMEATRVDASEARQYFQKVAQEWRDNLNDLTSFTEGVSRREQHDEFARWGEKFLRANQALIDQRAEQGWVRDVHGDLHCEHVCFAPEGVEIFDCIEFDPALRRCDLAAEIAFLVMDLEVRNGATFAGQFLERYLEIVNDPEQTKLLDFFKCYRALVRAKVYALRGAQGFSQAEKYFRYAERFLWRHTVLVIVCGLTGSGKSTLARELGSSLGWPVFNSDVIRKQMTGVTGRHLAAVDESIYSPVMTSKTYAKLLREAEKSIAKGSGAILDATFARREQRESVLRMARKHNLPVFFFHCEASAEITRARLAQRNAVGRDISDGRWAVYEKQLARADAMNDIPELIRLDLNTDAPLSELITRCKQFLRLHTHDLTNPS